MKPINKKERAKAFYQIITLFLVCFVIAMILGFTTMNVPKFSNNKSNKDLEVLQEKFEFQEITFAPYIDSVTNKITTVPGFEGDLKMLHDEIATLLNEVKREVVQDESWESTMYMNVINTYSSLRMAYEELQNMITLMENSSGSDAALQLCMSQKSLLEAKVKELENASSGGGGGSDNSAALVKQLEQCQKDLEDCRKVKETQIKEILDLQSKIKK